MNFNRKDGTGRLSLYMYIYKKRICLIYLFFSYTVIIAAFVLKFTESLNFIAVRLIPTF